jgi:large subunit ribosomal protein L10
VLKRAEKEQWVASIREQLQSAEAIFLVDYRGLTVAEVNRLRKRLRLASSQFQVVKNTLLKRAAEGTDSAALAEHFTGPTAIAVARTDAVAPAKVLTEFAKEVPKLELRVALLKGRPLTPKEVDQLAKLPSLGELRSKLLGLFQAPAGQLVRLLATPGGQLARAMALRRDQLPSGEAPQPAESAPEAPAEAPA